VSDRPSLFERLWRRPQGVWARRALFQIHLWSGIGVGIYLIVISLTGSFLVFRTELHRMFSRPPVTVAVQGNPLSEERLKAAALIAFSNHTVTNVWPAKRPEEPVEIWLSPNSGGSAVHRIFDPYTGKDLGPPDPAMVRFIIWSVSLHDDLLTGEKGRAANGIGAVLLTVLCFTGFVIWWPGVTNWRRSLSVELQSNWKLFNWHLHSALGFWSFLLVLMWALSGIYLAFPNPFQQAVDYFEPLQNSASTDVRIGDEILRWLSRLHFGRFGGWPIKALWTALGLVPLVLFITGAVMWWNRVLRPRMQRLGQGIKPETAFSTAESHQDISITS
jgi:uncharacterized iron-regulated membrane protein